jgi:DNA-binding transcriptional MerR regulator
VKCYIAKGEANLAENFINIMILKELPIDAQEDRIKIIKANKEIGLLFLIIKTFIDYLKKGNVATAQQRRVYDYMPSGLLIRPINPPSAYELLPLAHERNNHRKNSQSYLNKADEMEKKRATLKEKEFLAERKKLQETFREAVNLLEASINHHNDLMASAVAPVVSETPTVRNKGPIKKK